MQLTTHSTLKRVVDHLVLLHPAFAYKRTRLDQRRIMVAVATQVLDAHTRIRQSFLDQPLDFPGVHRHRLAPLPENHLGSAIKPGSHASWLSRNAPIDMV